MSSDLAPLCIGEEQNTGAWHSLHGDEARAALDPSPPCCGEHVERLDACKPSGRLTDWYSHACTCSGLSRNGTRLARGSHVYQWRPSRCQLLPWNATRFCERLGSRRLLFLGDSTMRQHHATLFNMIAFDKHAHCAEEVSFVPSDTITMAAFGRLNRGFPIRKVLAGISPPMRRRPPYDVVVLSTGAHIVNDTDFESVLGYVTSEVPSAFPRVRLIWKTQHPAGCSRDVRPLHAYPDNAFYEGQAGGSFNWRTFEGRKRP